MDFARQGRQGLERPDGRLLNIDTVLKTDHNQPMITSFFTSLGSKENAPLVAAFAVAASVLLALGAPAEETLGQAVKLVYIHAALMWVAFGLLTLSGLLGGLYFVRRSPRVFSWSGASMIVAVALLLGTGSLGLITAKITWGGVFWAEPRLMMLGQILVIGIAAVFVARTVGESLPAAGAAAVAAAAAWVLLLRTERVIHPVSPIFSSDSAAIKIFPLLITVCLAFAGLQVVRYIVKLPN